LEKHRRLSGRIAYSEGVEAHVRLKTLNSRKHLGQNKGRRGNKVYGVTGLEGHFEAIQLLGICSSAIKRGLSQTANICVCLRELVARWRRASLLPISPLPIATRLPSPFYTGRPDCESPGCMSPGCMSPGCMRAQRAWERGVNLGDLFIRTTDSNY
jgi:hypothetical protein